MDYKKKYKEALKVIGSLYNVVRYQSSTDALLTSQTIEKAFPELKESEDERIRKGLIKGLSAMRDIHKHQTFSDDAINIDDAIAWLEKQKQCEQPQQEWNAKDNEMLKNVIQRIKDLDHYWNKPTDEKMIDWLKSLKPNHWKPSEEQMEALEYAIICRTMPWEQLGTLYNDLKNL